MKVCTESFEMLTANGVDKNDPMFTLGHREFGLTENSILHVEEKENPDKTRDLYATIDGTHINLLDLFKAIILVYDVDQTFLTFWQYGIENHNLAIDPMYYKRQRLDHVDECGEIC